MEEDRKKKNNSIVKDLFDVKQENGAKGEYRMKRRTTIVKNFVSITTDKVNDSMNSQVDRQTIESQGKDTSVIGDVSRNDLVTDKNGERRFNLDLEPSNIEVDE